VTAAVAVDAACDDWRVDTDAARHPERFTGLIEHLERHAGACAGAEPPTVHGGNRGYALAFYALPENGPVTVISNGLRFQAVSASLEQELACTLHADQAEAARHLVDTVCGLVIERGQGVDEDVMLDNGNPLLAGTDIHGVIAGPHPFFPEDFDLFHDESDTVALRVVTLVPATAADLAFANEFGVERLRERWAEEGTDVLDVERGTDTT